MRGETIDHMPPISIFDQRRRPKGFEFLACAPCNSGSKGDEQVVSWLSRIYPDAIAPEHQAEVRKILQSIKNNHPGLLEEMLPSPHQESQFQLHGHKLPGAAGALNVAGPLVNSVMLSFGGKLGLAMHYTRTGKIVKSAGCVGVRWHSNHDAIVGDLPEDFLAILGRPETLKQGRFEVPDQFSVSSVVPIEGDISGHFATFRKSFAIAAIVAEDDARLTMVPETHKIRPGWLRNTRRK